MPLTRRWIEEWSAIYPADYDAESIGGLAGKLRPSYDDIRRAVAWKSRRSLRGFASNDRRLVESTVARSIGAVDDLGALMALTVLKGVQERVASGILTAFIPSRFTVMDVRAWHSLRAHGLLEGLDGWSWGATWLPYLDTCRRLAERFRVELRDLDRALWKADGNTKLPGG